MFYNLVEYVKNSLNFDNSLNSRMKKLESKYNNNKSHPFKPHVFSLKSKKLLSFINETTDFNVKIHFLQWYNNVLRKVCSKLYERFDPSMIYTFNNEIHCVFYYNDHGDYKYDGNINRMLSNMSSYTSVLMNEELKSYEVNLDFTFECTYVEFDVEYECLNYIIWRQLDCKRNLTTLLYKCHKNDGFLDLKNIKLKELEKELNSSYNNFSDSLSKLCYGTIVKKQIVKDKDNNQNNKIDCISSKEGFEITKETNKDTERKQVVYKHFWLFDDFTKTFEEYIVNKFLNETL